MYNVYAFVAYADITVSAKIRGSILLLSKSIATMNVRDLLVRSNPLLHCFKVND